MEQYLKKVCLTGIRLVNYCSDAIEEINDGDERSFLILSIIETVYSYQFFLSALKSRYPEYFIDSKSTLSRNYRSVMRYRPESLLRVKKYRQCGVSFSQFVDLPF